MGLTSLSWPHRIDCCYHLKHVRCAPSLFSSYFITFEGVFSILSKRCLNGCVCNLWMWISHNVFCNLVPLPGHKCLGKCPSHRQQKCWRYQSLMLLSSPSLPCHSVTGGLGGCTGSHFVPVWSFCGTVQAPKPREVTLMSQHPPHGYTLSLWCRNHFLFPMPPPAGPPLPSNHPNTVCIELQCFELKNLVN